MAVKSVQTAKEALPISRTMADFFKRVLRSKPTIIGSVMVLFILCVALFAPWIAPHNPATQHPDGLKGGIPARPFENPKYILGTDHLGRDVLSRLIYGSRISLAIGCASVVFATSIGLGLGVVAGFYRGALDMIIMRIIDVFMGFPSFLLTMATMSSLKPGFGTLLFSISIVRWVGTARLIRSNTISLKEQEYVTAAYAVGVSEPRILRKYILPNCLPLVIVNLTMGIAGAILVEASLSFLGLGVQPPTPSWGMMVNEARGFMFFRPSLVFLPSAAISFAVLAFSILGDGLRDVLDPRLRGTN